MSEKLGDLYVDVLGDIQPFIKSMDKVQQKVQSTVKVVDEIGKVAQRVGAGMAKVGAAISAPYILSAKKGMEFSDQMLKVRAVTQASTQDFGKLNDKAKLLGRTTSFTAGQVGSAMEYMGLAGFKTEQILTGIPDVLNLAKAGTLDLGRASDIATDLMSAFEMEAKDLKRVTDVLATTQANANTNIDQLGEAYKYAAPVLKNAGQSIEESGALLGVLANRMLKGSVAGTGLAVVMRKITDPVVMKKLQSMGVAVDIGGKVRNLSDIFKDLDKSMKGMTQVKKLQLTEELFDARGQKVALNLLSAMNKEFDELKMKELAAAGSAEKMAEIMDSGLGGAWRRMLSALEGVELAISDSIEKPLIKVYNTITEYLTIVTDWIKNHQSLVKIIGIVGVVLTVIGSALFVLGGIITSVVAVVGSLVLIFTTLIPIVAPFIPLILSIGAALTAVGAIIMGVGSAFLYAIGDGESFFDRVLSGVGKVASAMYSMVETVVGYVSNIIGFFAHFGENLWHIFDWIVDNWHLAIWDMVKMSFIVVKNMIANFITLGEKIVLIFTNIVLFISNIVKNVVMLMYRAFTIGAKFIWEKIKGIFKGEAKSLSQIMVDELSKTDWSLTSGMKGARVNITKGWANPLEGFERSSKKLQLNTDWKVFSDDSKKVADKILEGSENMKDAADKIVDEADLKATVAEPTTQLAGAFEKGSTEAYKIDVARNVNSTDKNIEKNTKQSVTVQEELLTETKRLVAIQTSQSSLSEYPIA